MKQIIQAIFVLLSVACAIAGAFTGKVWLMVLAVPLGGVALFIQLQFRASHPEKQP